MSWLGMKAVIFLVLLLPSSQGYQEPTFYCYQWLLLTRQPWVRRLVLGTGWFDNRFSFLWFLLQMKAWKPNKKETSEAFIGALCFIMREKRERAPAECCFVVFLSRLSETGKGNNMFLLVRILCCLSNSLFLVTSEGQGQGKRQLACWFRSHP